MKKGHWFSASLIALFGCSLELASAPARLVARIVDDVTGKPLAARVAVTGHKMYYLPDAQKPSRLDRWAGFYEFEIRLQNGSLKPVVNRAELRKEALVAGFVAYRTPTRMPFFPFNYLTSQPTYRADETGRIRMVRVHWTDQRCPPDAPVVLQISEAEITEMYERIREIAPAY